MTLYIVYGVFILYGKQTIFYCYHLYTVSELQNLLDICERELEALDLIVNVKKIILPTNRTTYSNVNFVWHTLAMHGQLR